MGRWLVLGGTRFLSHAVAAAAVSRGHDVVDTARAALAHEHALGPDRPRQAGLTPADETDLLPTVPPPR